MGHKILVVLLLFIVWVFLSYGVVAWPADFLMKNGYERLLGLQVFAGMIIVIAVVGLIGEVLMFRCWPRPKH